MLYIVSEITDLFGNSIISDLYGKKICYLRFFELEEGIVAVFWFEDRKTYKITSIVNNVEQFNNCIKIETRDCNYLLERKIRLS